MNNKELTKRILVSKDFLFRLSALALILAGTIYDQYRFILLLLSGLALGTYYGLYNDMIWRPKGRSEESIPYRAHQVWIHLICGSVGSIAFYFLLGVIDINNPSLTLSRLSLKEFILFGLAIMGYIGLFPRILWYFSYAQQNMFSTK